MCSFEEIAIQISVCCFPKLIWYLVFNFPSLYQSTHTALSQGAGDYSKFNQGTPYIKRHLPLGRKVMTNLESLLKSRAISLPTKFCLVKAMVFPGVMYGCESWTIKKAERRRIGAFELWCWRRLLRVPWTARRSNQSLLKEISPEYSLEGLMLKLKLFPS